MTREIKREIAPMTLTMRELIELARTTELLGDSTWIAHGATSEWYGGIDLKRAGDCLEFGWTDAPAIESVTIPRAPNFIPDVDYSFDVTGNQLDVATYLTGQPEHWLAPEYVDRPADNILKLSIEIGGSWKVDARAMEYRGQAIIALVNSLELSGLSVELVLVHSWLSKRTGIKRTILVTVKRAGEALDMNRLQFMVAHPAFYRRVLLGIHENLQGKSLKVSNSYSLTHTLPGYVHINYLQGLASSLDAAMEWARNFGQVAIQSATAA